MKEVDAWALSWLKERGLSNPSNDLLEQFKALESSLLHAIAKEKEESNQQDATNQPTVFRLKR